MSYRSNNIEYEMIIVDTTMSISILFSLVTLLFMPDLATAFSNVGESLVCFDSLTGISDCVGQNTDGRAGDYIPSIGGRNAISIINL
jgi:hypothetical protein